MAKDKIKLALYWGATCGGCDIAVLDLNEKILDVAAIADIVFWPIAMDFKYKDVEAMKDGEIDITLYNGGIVNSENEEIAKLLRRKSKIMIAFGSCACFGGIPGLTNITTTDATFETVYQNTASTVNPDFVTPLTKTIKDGHKLTLPEKYDTARSLFQTVDVDYFVPGCPPAVELIEKVVAVISSFVESGELPPKGSVIASEKSLCDECELEKEEKAISRIYRSHEIIPDPKKCLLEQGLICMGPATRGGCGARCINVLMPCRGCMGPTAEVGDQGAKMLSALASILGIKAEEKMSEEEIEKLIDQVKDPLGTFYRFTLPTSLLKRSVIKEKKGERRE